MPQLNEVFGIMQEVPRYTYVDRAGLDSRLKYLLGTTRHIVIYGASKQGKTSLRRSVLPDDKSVVVRCRLRSTLEDVYASLLQNLGVYVPAEQTRNRGSSGKISAEVSGQAKIPLVAQGGAKASAEIGGASNDEHVGRVPGNPTANLDWIAEQIKLSGKRVVVEDFHYLEEEQRRRLAFDLKALWDAGVFVIVIGIWAQHDLLTFYNGDLSGRVEDIDLVWTSAELDEVLRRGEQALQVQIAGSIRSQMIGDAAQNVGLLQRLAEKMCSECNVFASMPTLIEIGDESALSRTREAICRAERQRYKQFSDAVTRGFKQYEDSALRVYEHIVRVCLDSTDKDLIDGVPKEVLLRRIQAYSPEMRMSDLSGALNRIDRLQSDRDISPLVFTFSGGKISLVDRELLFFRRYGEPVWPWAHPEGEAQS